MKKFLIVTSVTLLILFTILLIKNEYARTLPSSTYGMSQLIDAQSIDHLFIGSSMFRQGLSIYDLEDIFGSDTYILSYNGNQPALIAAELSYLLEQGVTIKHLYIDLYPYSAEQDPTISDTKILLDTDIDFKISILNLIGNEGWTRFIEFYEVFVTANNEELLFYPLHSALINQFYYKGGNLQVTTGSTIEVLDDLSLFSPTNQLQDEQIAGYESIIASAEKYNIELYFIETPKYVRITEDATYQYLLQECIDLLDDHHIPYVLAEELDFDITNPDYFMDLIHLSSSGSVQFTRLLCEWLLNII
ncbi:MAG: hypothetical protein R3Y67_02640 [Eubacteriales bacterium]